MEMPMEVQQGLVTQYMGKAVVQHMVVQQQIQQHVLLQDME